MIRNLQDNTFDNFTILANEAATVDAKKYRVWSTPPNLYSLKVRQLHLLSQLVQGIVDMNRNGNFCKETWVSKIVVEAKVDARVEQ